MEKIVKDGRVAVAISPGYGAGWSTWNGRHSELLIFHPKIIGMIQAERQKEITEKWMNDNFELPNIYTGGASQLEIEWVSVGKKFTIIENDGSEQILSEDDLQFTA